MVGVRWDGAEDGVQAEEGRGEGRNKKADIRLELPTEENQAHLAVLSLSKSLRNTIAELCTYFLPKCN